MRRRLGSPLLVGAVAVGLTLTACASGASDEPAPDLEARLVVAEPAQPPNLDPMVSTATATSSVAVNVFETLLTTDENLEIQPMLAERFEVSDDGASYTFHLRDGVKFHDGTSLDSADVVASMERWSRLSGPGQSYFTGASWTAVDELTVRLDLETPSFGVPLALSGHPAADLGGPGAGSRRAACPTSRARGERRSDRRGSRVTIRYGESISKGEEPVSASAEDPTLGQRLAASPARAGSAERRILDHIAARPGEVLFASASEIGHATGTSDASVIRTVQRLGYPGLKDFKTALRASLDQGTISAAMRESDGGAVRTSEPRRRVATPDVYAELRELILTGGISTDRYVTEVELAARFGVSRTPVREALRILEQKGLIVRDHRGVRAPVQTRAEMNELYDAHILLNSALVRRACERRTTADIETMRTLNRVMRELPLERAGSQEAAAANRRFHEASWDAARDRTLGVLVRQLNDQLDQWSGTTLDEPGRWPQSLDEHDAVIDAIEQRDAERAEAIVTAHLEAARRIRQARYPA